MDVNSNLLKLKLDMVYRDVSAEDALKRYTELTQAVSAPAPGEIGSIAGPKKRRKVVKALVPKK